MPSPLATQYVYLIAEMGEYLPETVSDESASDASDDLKIKQTADAIRPAHFLLTFYAFFISMHCFLC